MTDHSPLRPVSDEHRHVPADYEAGPRTTLIFSVEVSGRRIVQVFGGDYAHVDERGMLSIYSPRPVNDLVAAFVPGTWGSFTTDEVVVQ